MWRLGAAAALVLLTGCAPEATPLLHEDLDRLRADLVRSEKALQKSQADVKAELQQSDLRTTQTLSEVQRSLGRLTTRVDELARDSAQMQGRLEELRRRVDLLALQLDMAGAPGGSAPTGQPGAAATRSGGNPPAGPNPATSSQPATAQRAPSNPGGEASDLYQTAYIDYTRGNYNLAIAAFKEFLRRYPTSDLADKAQYWIGESHYSLARTLQGRGERDRAIQEFERARQEFQQVLVAYPRGSRVPVALYKEALTLIELGQPSLAEARLRTLLDQYPSTEEAEKAKDELARIKKR